MKYRRGTRGSAKAWLGLATLVLLLGAGTSARATGGVQYLGPHPVDPSVHAGMCYIDGPHIHAYVPTKKVLYVRSGAQWAFVGDPVEFEASAPKYLYNSHHPLFWVGAEGAEVEHYCYITGPHYHWYEPPKSLSFKLKGGVYWYVGAHPPWYQRRWRRHRRIDNYYAHVSIPRPTITITPPTGFVVYAGAQVGGGVVVGGGGGGGIGINVRLPSVGVIFGGGGERHYRGRRYRGPRGEGYGHRKWRGHRGRGHKWGRGRGHKRGHGRGHGKHGRGRR